MYKHIFVTALTFLFIAGCGKPELTEEQLALIPMAQREGLPAPSGGLVLAVSGETITADEIIAPLMERFKPAAQSQNFETFKTLAKKPVEQILTNKVADILLYKKAKAKLGENIDDTLEKAVESEVRKFIVSFGGDYAKAEQTLRLDGMDWQSFREFQKKRILSQSYISQQLPEQKPITYSELLDSYNQIKDTSFTTEAKLKFQLIDIQPDKLALTDPNSSRQQAARELADELFERISTGEDFGRLAEKYSHGHRAALGGQWKPVNPDSLAPPYDTLVALAQSAEPGQIAGPIEAAGHIFIMKLQDKQAASIEPFEKVQSQLEARIIRRRHAEAIGELSGKLIQQANLTNKDEFILFCMHKLYLVSNR